MLKVGLTGSIAVGKTFVCSVMSDLGCFVLDADKTAREVVAAGTVGLAKIEESFGPDVLLANGELNRVKMGEIVFADEEKRQLLNSIVHPLVFEAQDKWLQDCKAESPKGIAIVDAALMIESGGYKRFDKLIVVWCRPEIQFERLMNRNHLNKEQALARINAQMPQEEKKSFADYLIDTSDGFDAARKETERVWRELRLLIN